MELTEFLRARLDEEEAGVYGLCGNGPLARWVIRDGDLFVGTEPLPDEPIVQTWDERIARHIARHDPARVLREVEAKRKRLALMIEATAEMDKLLADPHAGDVEQAMAIGRARAATVAVKYDAEIWDGHADYDPKWKPDRA